MAHSQASTAMGAAASVGIADPHWTPAASSALRSQSAAAEAVAIRVGRDAISVVEYPRDQLPRGLHSKIPIRSVHIDPCGMSRSGLQARGGGLNDGSSGSDSDDSAGLSPRWTDPHRQLGGEERAEVHYGHAVRGEGGGSGSGRATSHWTAGAAVASDWTVDASSTSPSKSADAAADREEEVGDDSFPDDETGKLRGVTDFNSLMEYCFD